MSDRVGVRSAGKEKRRVGGGESDVSLAVQIASTVWGMR